jgi:hypothetical protein
MFNYDIRNLWNSTEIDKNILDFLRSKSINKYKQNSEIYDFDKEYILFPLQSLHYTSEKVFIKCILWAQKNQKYIIFKKHPFSNPGDFFDSLWNILKKKGLIGEYVKLIDHQYNLDSLIDNAKQVWCCNSGAGMQALIKGKPVSFFTEAKNGSLSFVEYYEIAKFVKSPEEAYANNGVNHKDLARYFSWYYHKFVIDLENSNYEDKLYERMYKFYVERKTLEELF